MTYEAPIKDMLFSLKYVADYKSLHPAETDLEEAWEIAGAVLEEAGRLAADEIEPLNRIGDLEGAVFSAGKVSTPKGFPEAYAMLGRDGWFGLAMNPDQGGQGLPLALSAAVSEMWASANLSFSLCGVLTIGAMETLDFVASEALCQRYIPKMITGEWTGTMNLTEPQAGSDLAAIRAVAEPQADGTYRVKGQKIFISHGEHDMAENIIHLVLARTPGAPEGVKGLSLFVVPKILPKPDSSLGEANDLACISTEHKLGLHASPTCVMSFGDQGGATGWLIGKEGEGLKIMFLMMNRARFEVGLQGLGVAEAARQFAVSYAEERVQGVPIGHNEASPIMHHPDVKRMLYAMESRCVAVRALALLCAANLDLAGGEGEEADKQKADARAQLLVPLVKSWGTDTGNEAASTGLQVHGGVGYIEETGAAQYFRDARILSIYEGTNGIQANDLVFRKILRDKGEALLALLAEAEHDCQSGAGPEIDALAEALRASLVEVRKASDWLLTEGERPPRQAAAAAYPFMQMLTTFLGGWLHIKSARAAQALMEEAEKGGAEFGLDFLTHRLALARYFIRFELPSAAALSLVVREGAEVLEG